MHRSVGEAVFEGRSLSELPHSLPVIRSLHIKQTLSIASYYHRDSKLTRLLQDGIDGKAKTLLLATVSPLSRDAEETISTLKFADRAKQVKSRVMMLARLIRRC